MIVHSEPLTTWGAVAKLQVDPAPNHRDGPEAIYRGMADEKWCLKPSLVRLLKAAKIDNPNNPDHVVRAVAAEEQALRVFQTAHPWPGDRREWIVWWAMAQHFGGATRVLDWSGRVGVAVYFAVASEPQKTGALYVLKQRELRPKDDLERIRVYNEECKSLGWKARRDEGWALQQDIFRLGNPVWMHVCATLNTPPRLAVQAGFVTSCTNILKDHREVIDDKYPDGTLTQYIIPAAAKRQLLMEAAEHGFSGAALFHDSTESAGYAQRDALMRSLDV